MTYPRPLHALVFTLLAAGAAAQPFANDKLGQPDWFRPVSELLPTPSEVRLASGAPGPKYWQQRADHVIDVTLDTVKHRIVGKETIRYQNCSPHTLDYLWLQLDANIFKPGSLARQVDTGGPFEKLGIDELHRMLFRQTFDGGITLSLVADGEGRPLAHTVVDTTMRVDLPAPLASGGTFELVIAWSYTINDAKLMGGRTAMERFDDGQVIYEIAQWFPRMAIYTDSDGWQHKPYIGRGEFALEFGDYLVRITAPADHVVAATGELQNPDDVLTPAQRERLVRARTAAKPVYIVEPGEIKDPKTPAATTTKTWVYSAKNVRDFAFASSPRFMWDAMGVQIGERRVLAMSYFPTEGEPLWSQYSTESVAHALEVYSRHALEYPYPVAISVNGPVGGMEYPMLSFNGARPEKDKTYSPRAKYGLIMVIVHEVGHNWFPMIINSDERRWTWMDEGLNTFVQYLAERAWEREFPSRRGEPVQIAEYMASKDQRPIMSDSEAIMQFGNNSYAKPAAALNVLRETVLGRERFDFAFRTYCRRWAFKRPAPADFFRTMEDASGADLGWFWRGWFYSTEHTDQRIAKVTWLDPKRLAPFEEKPIQKAERDGKVPSVAEQRNADLLRRLDLRPGLDDFYNHHDPFAVTDADRDQYAKLMKSLTPEEKKALDTPCNLYAVEIENAGGLVMPVVLELGFADGTSEVRRYAPEIWAKDCKKISKLVIAPKPVVRFALDPYREIADVEPANNVYPPEIARTRFELFKAKDEPDMNPMRQERQDKEKRAKREKEEEERARKEREQAAGSGAPPADASPSR